MRPTDILKEAEADLASLAGLPGEIRAKVKAGVAELTRIRDAIDATIASLTGSAQVALASLEAMAASAVGRGGLDPAGQAPAQIDAAQPDPAATLADAAQADPLARATASFG